MRLISCSNCHENLRYSFEILIDVDLLEKGILNMECMINGDKWTITDCNIRVAHRALIKKMNMQSQ